MMTNEELKLYIKTLRMLDEDELKELKFVLEEYIKEKEGKYDTGSKRD